MLIQPVYFVSPMMNQFVIFFNVNILWEFRTTFSDCTAYRMQGWLALIGS